MERTGVEILGVSELRWTEAGHFESEGHNVYYSSNENTRSKGVAVICTRKMAKAVLGFIPMNDRMMAVRLQRRPINITLIQLYASISIAAEEI